MAPKCPQLRIIVSMTPLPAAERNVLTQWASSVNVELLTLEELEAWGATEGILCVPGPVAGVPEDHEIDRLRVITISYTSGTTGEQPYGLLRAEQALTDPFLRRPEGCCSHQLEHGHHCHLQLARFESEHCQQGVDVPVIPPLGAHVSRFRHLYVQESHADAADSYEASPAQLPPIVYDFIV